MEGDRRGVSEQTGEGKTHEREEERSNSTMRGDEEKRGRGSKKGQWKGGREGTRKQRRGSVKRGRRLRQAVHISWLPLIIRAFP